MQKIREAELQAAITMEQSIEQHDDRWNREEEIRQQRNRFYPYWWIHEGRTLGSEDMRPLYRVVVQDEVEKQLAESVRPSGIDVHYEVIHTEDDQV